MTTLFWLALALVLYTYLGYPALIALLAHLHPRGWRKSPWPLEESPAPVSIVMAVHNGAPLLAAKIDSLLALSPSLIREVIVLSDGSTDGSASILSPLDHPRLKAIILPEHAGKSAALNHGIAAASAPILLFVDIRPRVLESSVAALLANFADPSVGCVAGELVLSSEGHDAAASAVSGLYWRYEQWIRNCEAAWDSPVGVYGGFYAIRRSVASPYPAGLILDDMFQPLSVIRQGFRSVLDRSAIVTDVWPGKSAGEYGRKVRTLAGNFQLLTAAPWLLTPQNRVLFQLVSHKLMRLVVPWCFLALLFTSALLGRHSPAFAAFALLQAAFWLLALASLFVRIPLLGRLASPAGALLVLNAAAIGGLYKFLFTRGPLWKIWSATPVPLTPPRSADTAPRTPPPSVPA